MANATAASGVETNPTSGLNYVKSGTSKRSSGTEIDTGTFLKLIVAQMQYQDPLEPQSNTDFVAQLAMMAGLEQVQSMNGSLSTSKAINYVGKQIYATVLNSQTGKEEKYSGVVTGIVMKNGDAYAIVGDNAICVDAITAVVNIPENTETGSGAQDPAPVGKEAAVQAQA